jgi:hypothetical protein
MSVSRKQFDAFARRNLAIDRAVKRAIDELWDMLDKDDLESLLNDLAIQLPLVADKFGKAAAMVSAEFYDASRVAAKAKGMFSATTASGALWKVDRDVAYAFSDDFAYNDVKSFLTQSVQGVVRDYGRETIRENCKQDRWSDGYCSVPTSDNPCAFCIIKALGSPGGNKRYKGELLDEEVYEDAWHADCKCILEPIWGESPNWVEGQYDEYWDMYQAGRTQAYNDTGKSFTEGLTAKEVLSGMRKANGVS